MAVTFTNQATLRYNGEVLQSNIAEGLLAGALSVTKRSVADEYRAGDTITYLVSIVNHSDFTAADLTLSDNLGAYAFEGGMLQPMDYTEGSVQYYRNGVLQPAPAVVDSDGLRIAGLTIPANGSVMIVYASRLNDLAPLAAGSSITNRIGLTGDDVCDAEAEATITAEETAIVSLEKTILPIPVSENSELTYTLTLLNNGNTAVTSEDNAVITDFFDPILTGLSVTLNREALTESTDYTYDEATGLFTTADGVITIPAATYTQNPSTSAWAVTPGTAVLTVTGTVGSVCDIASAQIESTASNFGI